MHALRTLSAAALAVAAVVSVPTSAEAASPLQIGTWRADPAGSDKPNNTGYNSEWIQVVNKGRTALNLTGYYVRDVQNHRFVFPRGFVLKPRATVTIHSGSGTSSAAHLYWKQGSYVWNNTGDTATLLSPKSVRLDSCTYRKGRGTIAC